MKALVAAMFLLIWPAALPAQVRCFTDWDTVSNTLLRLTEKFAPQAIARQSSEFGLKLPKKLNPNAPLVILIHGLDGDESCCTDLANLMHADGLQTAMFVYPGERHLADSAQMLQQQLLKLHSDFPNLRVDLVTQSMGGLVARDFIEGPDYHGGIDRLIMLAPPNNGSTWAKFSLLSKAITDCQRYHNDPQWSIAWIIGEGLFQAGDDLKPGSKFLAKLNARPRRADVQYTIVAGDLPAVDRYESDLLNSAAQHLPFAEYWGLRQVKAVLERHSSLLTRSVGIGDGPVSLASAKLDGVADFVAIHADHLALFETTDGAQPAAWPIVRDRLEKK